MTTRTWRLWIVSGLLCTKSVEGVHASDVASFDNSIARAAVHSSIDFARQTFLKDSRYIFLLDKEIFKEVVRVYGTSKYVREYEVGDNKKMAEQSTSRPGPIYYRVVLSDRKRNGSDASALVTFSGGRENGMVVKIELKYNGEQWIRVSMEPIEVW